MQSSNSYSNSQEIQSISMMELDASQDSDLLDLFEHVEKIEGGQIAHIHELMLKNFQNNLKNSKKNKKSQNNINNNDEIQDEQLDMVKEYNSECHERLSQQHGRRRYIRKSRVINQQEKKNKRKRVKIYIEMLENRCKELTNQLEKLKKTNNINKQYMKKFNESQQLLNGFLVSKQQIYEKLQSLVRQTQNEITKNNIANIPLFKANKIQSPDQCISQSNTKWSFTQNQQKLLEQVIALRMRLGVFGRDRIKTINYYFRSMIEMILPDAQKYLVFTAQNQTDIFSAQYLSKRKIQDNTQQWRKEMIQNMKLTNQQIRFVQQLKQKVIQQTKVFDHLLHKFYQNKCQLSKQARKMQVIFDKIHTKMSPFQIGLSLIYIQKYKYQKGISSPGDSLKQIIDKLQTDRFQYDHQDPFSLGKKYQN